MQKSKKKKKKKNILMGLFRNWRGKMLNKLKKKENFFFSFRELF